MAVLKTETETKIETEATPLVPLFMGAIRGNTVHFRYEGLRMRVSVPQVGRRIIYLYAPNQHPVDAAKAAEIGNAWLASVGRTETVRSAYPVFRRNRGKARSTYAQTGRTYKWRLDFR